jgi:hypothetical protein
MGVFLKELVIHDLVSLIIPNNHPIRRRQGIKRI